VKSDDKTADVPPPGGVATHGNIRVVYLGSPAVVRSLVHDLMRAGAHCQIPEEPHCLTLPLALLRRILSGDAALTRLAAWPGTQVWFFTQAFDAARVLPRLDADLVVVDERKHVPFSGGTRARPGARRPRPLSSRVSTSPAPPQTANGANDDPSLESAGGIDTLGTERELPNLSPTDPSNLSASDVLVNVAGALDDGPSEALASPIVFEDLRGALQQFTPRGFHFPMRRIMVVLPEAKETAERTFQLGLANVRRVLIAPPSSAELMLFATHQIADFRMVKTKTALCVSGGGLEGYIYAVGVSQALEECFAEKHTTDFDIYCGVSSGALLATSFASGITTDDLLGQLYKRKGKLEALSLSVIFDFAGGEIAKRVLDLLRAVPSLDPSEFVARLQRVVPVGFFKGERLKTFIEQQLARVGMTDNFAALPKELYISSTDQDTGEHVVFGEEPWRDVRVSQAVRASTALPPFYLPERIKGHWFTDGQLVSSSDFNTAIRKGARLVVLIDPMVAYSTGEPGAVMKLGGYFTAVQAIKSLVHTRAQSFLLHSMDVHPDVDFVVFRPTDEVMEAMAGNPMRYRIRTELAELGYKGTLGQILAQYAALSHRFGKHGFVLKPEAEIRALLAR